MLSRKENGRARARAWLETEAPVPHDEDTLQKAQDEAMAIVREAKDNDASPADPRVIGDPSQSYYAYLLGPRYRGPKSRGSP
ncbi:MAG TPA: hypothetical protein VKA79_04785 [Aestuariivirgaceae bacterium]|jgi:hypothetical protein|nr:hypothetical protein [Aestuariivirgaceae bacterium]